MYPSPRPSPRGGTPHHRPAPLLLLLVAALILLPARAAPQAQDANPGGPAVGPSVFSEQLDVHLVEVDVRVTGRDGEPVTGLGRDDFRLLVDGEEVPIAHFEAVGPVNEPRSERTSGLSSGTSALPPLHLAVVVDADRVSPAGRRDVVDRLRQHLARLVAPGDRVMIATLQPLPTVLQGFTTDPEAMGAALDRVLRTRAGDVSLDVLKRQVRREIAQGQFLGTLETGTDLDSLDNHPRSAVAQHDVTSLVVDRVTGYAARADLRNRRTYEGLRALVDALASLPGDRAVLFVSENLSPRPAEGLVRTLLSNYPALARGGLVSAELQAGRWDSSQALSEVARHAGAAAVRFYAVDAGGAGSQAGDPGRDLSSTSLATDRGSRGALQQLAAATAGAATPSPAGLGGILDRLAADRTHRYTLAFESPHGRDGELHRLEVRLPAHRGARVHHPAAVRARTVEQEMADRTIAALVLDRGDNPLEVRIELGEERRRGRHRYDVPVVVKVPASRLALIPDGASHRGALSVYVAARDDRGWMSPPRRSTLPVVIGNDRLFAALTHEVTARLDLELRGGEGELAVLVRDDVAGVASVLNLSLAVGDAVGDEAGDEAGDGGRGSR